MNTAKGRPAPCLRLFGGFTLDRPGLSGDGLSYEKARALLAYVAVESDTAHPRRALATLFWPDHAPTAALANLRLVLLNLRQTLDAAGLPLLLIDREAVRFDPAELPRVDTARLSVALARAGIPASQVVDEAMLQELETAALLYRGEFLAGFSLHECPDFEAWLQLRREAWHRDALSLFERIAASHEARQNHVAALEYAVRCLDLAPWNEEAHRRVMRLLALNGQPGGALAQYENCCRILQGELGVRPGESTRQLAEQIGKGAMTRDLAPQPLPQPVKTLALPTELRQVTVLYGELAVLGGGDPEDTVALLYPAHADWCDIVRKHGGHVVPTYSGGLLAYFGYPQAAEHAARNALLAALEIARDKRPGVAFRAGVHTGMVVSGGTQAVPDVIGNTTAVAIRLRLLVDAGQVAVSRDASRLATGYFEFAEVGTHRLSGIAQPVEVSRLIGAGSAQDRLDAVLLAPMTGRNAELEDLHALWRDALLGRGHVLLIKGEAGIGKSRLLHEFKTRLAGQQVAVRELRCQAEFSGSPFHPVLTLFESILGFVDGEGTAAKFARLAEYLKMRYPSIAAEMTPLLASFMSLPVCAPFVEVALPLPARREAEFSLLLRLLKSLAEQSPVLLLVEDLHWADPSTLELLKNMIEGETAFPMLAVFTARLEFEPRWRKDLVATRVLTGLSREEIGAIIRSLAPELPPDVALRLVERADGIPLFAEELARLASEEKGDEIPATLRDLLAARLDATGEAKYTAQLAATIGRSFSLDLLSQVSPLAPQAVMRALHALEAAGLVETGDGVTYHFRHALFRDTAYQSQTRAVRKAAHMKIAQLLQACGGRDVGSRPELIAQHLAAGENYEQAVVNWLRAGSQASQRAANAEAVMLYRSGLSLLDRLEGSAEKLQLEFDLLNGLGLALSAIEGYASADASEAHARALALCERHAGSPDMFRALWGLWASASSRSGYELALDLARQLLRMAEEGEDPVHVQQAHFALGNTQFWRGEFTDAKGHLETVIDMHHAAYHARHVADFGEDVRITSGAYLGWVLDSLGQSEPARRASAEAVALARRAHHPFSLAYALTFAALLQCRLRRPEEALLLAEETRRLAESHGFHLWRIGAGIAAGWARVQQGEVAGVADIRRCVEETRMAMGGVSLVVLTPLADALAGLGHHREALSTIEEALQIGEALGDHHADAELLCLKGDALLAQAVKNVASAIACFKQAIAIASLQQAAALETRARDSLTAASRMRGGAAAA